MIKLEINDNLFVTQQGTHHLCSDEDAITKYKIRYGPTSLSFIDFHCYIQMDVDNNVSSNSLLNYKHSFFETIKVTSDGSCL